MGGGAKSEVLRYIFLNSLHSKTNTLQKRTCVININNNFTRELIVFSSHLFKANYKRIVNFSLVACRYFAKLLVNEYVHFNERSYDTLYQISDN